MEEPKNNQGAFLESLKRNNKQIKSDRAKSIGEDAEMAYKRQVEDYEIELRRLKRKQENLLDMSPDNALTLKLATNFDALEFVSIDMEIGIQIRELEIRLEIARNRYEYLFGG